MLWLLLCLLSPGDGSRSVTQDNSYEERHNNGESLCAAACRG